MRFPARDQMKPEQLEIAQLKREGDQAEGRTRHPKKSRGLLREGIDVKFGSIREAPGEIWPGRLVVRGARCLAGWLLCLADATSQVGAAGAMKSWAPRSEASFIASDRTYGGARRVWHDLLAEVGIVRSASSDRAIDAITGSQSSSSATSSTAAWIWVSGRSPPSLPTCSTAASRRRRPTCQNGLPTSPTCGPRKVGLYVAAVIDPVLSARGRLVDECSDDGAARDRCPGDGRSGAAASPDALLHHSDRGSQYTSEQFQKLMADNGIDCSMSRSGNVWDNAAMESFFSSLKTERTARKTYRTRDQAKADVFDYIERFYNAKRPSTSDNRLQEPHGVRDEGGISLGGCQPNRVQAIIIASRLVDIA